MNRYRGKTAVVTGGAAGIGQALCEELAHRGAHVIVVDVDDVGAQHVVAAITQQGGKAYAAHVDVSKEQDVSQLIENIVLAHGHLDFLFNNAGIAIGGDTRDLTSQQWHRVFDVDLFGVVNGTLSAYRVMVKQGFGHIVNTASVTGLLPQPLNAPYCTSKHAIVGLSLSLRYEGADMGVKVTVVCPGYVRTNMYQNMVVPNVPREKLMAVVSQRRHVEAPRAARIILDGVAHNRDIILFPLSVRWVWRLYRLFPRIFDGVLFHRVREFRKYRETTAQ